MDRTVTKNKEEGNAFEALVCKQAQRNGLLVIKNHLSCKFIYNGRLQLIKGELDYKIISQAGRVGYFDCKSFDKNHFVYSDLDKKQLERAVIYNNWSVPAGFLVWLRKTNLVIFYSGHQIARNGPRSRFDEENGQILGRWENFNIKPLVSV